VGLETLAERRARRTWQNVQIVSMKINFSAMNRFNTSQSKQMPP
jgi:hypothetical protein